MAWALVITYPEPRLTLRWGWICSPNGKYRQPACSQTTGSRKMAARGHGRGNRELGEVVYSSKSGIQKEFWRWLALSCAMKVVMQSLVLYKFC